MTDWVDKLTEGTKSAFKFIVRFSEILALAVLFGAAARLSENGLIYLLSLTLYICSIGYLAGGISYNAGYFAGRYFPDNRLVRLVKPFIVIGIGVFGVFIGSEIGSALHDLVVLQID